MPLARYLDVQRIQISASFTKFQFLFGLFSRFLCFFVVVLVFCCFLPSLQTASLSLSLLSLIRFKTAISLMHSGIGHG